MISVRVNVYVAIPPMDLASMKKLLFIKNATEDPRVRAKVHV